MPDQPDESVFDSELLGVMARLILDSFEGDIPPNERTSATNPEGVDLFEDGFRTGLLLAAMSLSYKLDPEEIDPAWNDDEVQDYVEAQLFAALHERHDLEVELAVLRLLREEGKDEGEEE